MSDSSSNPQLMAALALHYDELVEYIRRKFSRRDFARDLVHDVCIQMLEKPPKEKIALPLAFLRRTTFNRAVDWLRAERTRQIHASVPLSPGSGIDAWDGAHQLDFEQQLNALLDIIQSLSPRQRQVFLLHRIHGMAQRDIAVELGVSANMITQHFNHAMRAIVQRWEPARRLCQTP